MAAVCLVPRTTQHQDAPQAYFLKITTTAPKAGQTFVQSHKLCVPSHPATVLRKTTQCTHFQAEQQHRNLLRTSHLVPAKPGKQEQVSWPTELKVQVPWLLQNEPKHGSPTPVQETNNLLCVTQIWRGNL